MFSRLGAGQLHDFLVQGDCLLDVVQRRQVVFVLEIENVGLQESAFLIDLQHLKTVLAFGQNVHAAVGIFLQHVDDFGGAADVWPAFSSLLRIIPKTDFWSRHSWIISL